MDDWDLDVQRMTLELACAEVMRLRRAIRKHMGERGHGRCWLDDLELYRALPEAPQCEGTLPPKCEFLRECEKYWEQRQPV
jgi:hypothetical protein